MSLEIAPETIERVYASVDHDRLEDWKIVAGAITDAQRTGLATDGSFIEELADKRSIKAFGYDWPVPGTRPTQASSLRIVRDILTVQEFEASRDQRTEEIRALGTDVKFLNAEGLERSHRLWEKGVLRIFDLHTNTSMWSVEFDESLRRS